MRQSDKYREQLDPKKPIWTEMKSREEGLMSTSGRRGLIDAPNTWVFS